MDKDPLLIIATIACIVVLAILALGIGAIIKSGSLSILVLPISTHHVGEILSKTNPKQFYNRDINQSSERVDKVRRNTPIKCVGIVT